jgi:hypothetical protein
MIEMYRLLAIMVLLRLVPRDCWLVVLLAQNERYHVRSDAQQFGFCCLVLDGQVRKRFLTEYAYNFWRKGSPTLDFKKYCLYLLLYEYIKLGGLNRTNPWLSIPWLYWAIHIYISNCLQHQKGYYGSHFLKVIFMPALRGETTVNTIFSQVSQFRKLSQLLVKKKHQHVDLLVGQSNGGGWEQRLSGDVDKVDANGCLLG